jgi:hypothetical protein
MSVPELDELPELRGWESEIWVAFNAVHSQRSVGLAGADPLSVASVDAWLRAHGWAGELHTEALDLILLLDSEWTAWSRKDKVVGSGS